MDAVLGWLNSSEPALFGFPIALLAIWSVAGIVAGTLLASRRPIGLLGDMLVGILGGLVGGWVFNRFGINPASWISGIDEAWLGPLGALLTSLVGAIILLIILRIVIRRR